MPAAATPTAKQVTLKSRAGTGLLWLLIGLAFLAREVRAQYSAHPPAAEVDHGS